LPPSGQTIGPVIALHESEDAPQPREAVMDRRLRIDAAARPCRAVRETNLFGGVPLDRKPRLEALAFAKITCALAGRCPLASIVERGAKVVGNERL